MFLSVLIGVALIAAAAAVVPGSDIQTPSGTTLLATGPKGSKLYSIDAKSSVYEDAPYLLDLLPQSHYDQGYDAGYLLADQWVESYNALFVALLGDEWWEPALANLLGVFLDWQWNDYLSVQVPQKYLDEFAGMTEGGKAAGRTEDIGAMGWRGVVLANLPGDLSNFKLIIKDELKNGKKVMSNSDVDFLFDSMRKNWKGLTCSMFGVWGSRTDGGKLFTGRNLDWLKDSGISKNKVIAVYHAAGENTYATIGWAGLWGAITGISSKGITVHEANLESDDITFKGYPWVTRLREVMASTENIAEALAFWNSTGNTVGFNHGIGSAADNQAVCLETMKGNTAVFGANDPREREPDIVNGVNIAQAREEAVYRTNHGYDDYTQEHYIEGNPSYSITRYLLFPQMFDDYQAANKKITYIEAINITYVSFN